MAIRPIRNLNRILIGSLQKSFVCTLNQNIIVKDNEIITRRKEHKQEFKSLAIIFPACMQELLRPKCRKEEFDKSIY